jgi:threonine synthase
VKSPHRTPLPPRVSDQPFRAGGTATRDASELAAYFGVSALWIKDESQNPFGTHKDRKSEFILANLLDLNEGIRPDALCIFTSGNAGLSLARFAEPASISVIALIDPCQIVERSLLALQEVCHRVVAISSRDQLWTSAQLCLAAGGSDDGMILDATNCADAYVGLIDELDAFVPDVIVLPVGGGELFIGVYGRLKALGWHTRLIGVTVRRRNSIADKLYAEWTPYRRIIQQICLPDSRHQVIELHDEAALAETTKHISPHLACEYSSAAAFEALRLLKFKPSERILVVNTGVYRHLADR